MSTRRSGKGGSGLIRVSIGVLVICALGAATAFLPSGAPDPQPRIELEASEGPAGPLGEQPAARAEWFQRQRAYPAAEIPPQALARAVRQADRLELKVAVTAPPLLDWTSIGPRPILDTNGDLFASGRVTALAPVGDGTVTYLGAAQGGVWKTTDAGVHWTPIFDDAIGAGGTGLAIGSLVVDPADPGTLYVGTGEANVGIDSYFGGGIFKSTNAGSTWAKVGGAVFDTCHVADMEIRSGTILASAVRVGRWTRSCVGGVYRSTDGGATWTRTLTDDSDTDSPPIKPDGTPPIKTTGAFDIAPGVSGTWFATVYGDDPAHVGGNVFKSTTDGAGWTRLGGGLPTTGNGRTEIATAPTDRNRIYAAISSTRDADYGNLLGIYFSVDGGTTWTQRPSPASFCAISAGGGNRGACDKRGSIAVDPFDSGTVYAASLSPNRSSDSGQTWDLQNFGHADYNAFAFDTLGRLWIGNDGGVFRRGTDGSLDNLNSTLSLTQFEWGIAGEADADGPIFAGTQDNGVDVRRADGSWQYFTGGDGGAAVWRASQPQVVYAAVYVDYATKTTDGGVTSDDRGWFDLRAKEDPGEFFNFHPPLVMDPTDTQRLYFASTRVWRTTDAMTTWNPISPHFGADAGFAVQALGVTTSQDVVYAGTNNGRLELTTNARAGSPTWAETQANGLPNRTFTEIETMPGAPGTAYVTASGFDPSGGTGHVFKTTDFGAHWTNISANLPNAPANAIEIDWRTSPATVYVAMDVGVFWSQNGGLSWNNSSVGLPPLMVVDVKLDPVANKLIAATHGRGMYVAPVLPLRTTRTLALGRSGAGAGAVTSAPAGIDCGSTCLYDFDSGAAVTLTALPANGSVFSGWSGDCVGNTQCQLTMNADHLATAVFTLAPKTLTVTRAGAGNGTVASGPAGIDCGASCAHAFDHGATVTLNTTTAVGSTFTGWSGACSGTGPCTLTMNADQSVTATFGLLPMGLTVSKVGSGAGTITSSPGGIDCGPTCARDFLYGNEVTLTAVPAAGSSFTGWTNACSGTGTCNLTMTGARGVAAIFDSDKTLTVAKVGSGSILSSPVGIDCGSTCTHAFAHGASVTLTAQAASGATFLGWSGACSSTSSCTLTMDSDRSVTATFRTNPAPPTPPPAKKCVVPNVKRMTLAAAKRAIRSAHCAVGSIKSAFSSKRKGTVISQKPAPGTKRAAGAKVNVVLSKGKKR